ncbi:hypothetical protein GCM10010349_56710 [Streptomyces flavofungini]|nr:hypothetical protein GCM10010349_56710 [Streptomyces flavofungini]
MPGTLEAEWRAQLVHYGAWFMGHFQAPGGTELPRPAMFEGVGREGQSPSGDDRKRARPAIEDEAEG